MVFYMESSNSMSTCTGRVTGKPLWSGNCGMMAIRCHFLLQRATLWILQYILAEGARRLDSPHGRTIDWGVSAWLLNLNAPPPQTQSFFFFFLTLLVAFLGDSPDRDHIIDLY